MKHFTENEKNGRQETSSFICTIGTIGVQDRDYKANVVQVRHDSTIPNSLKKQLTYIYAYALSESLYKVNSEYSGYVSHEESGESYIHYTCEIRPRDLVKAINILNGYEK